MPSVATVAAFEAPRAQDKFRARREAGNRVAPEIIRRPTSSSDPRLRRLFHGERGLPFKQTEDL